MMDKQKQIEEMASCLIGEAVTGADSTKVLRLGYITVKEIAQILIGAGYRKISENAVVLTREEYDELQIGKDFNYGVHSGESNMTAYYENIRLPEVRKETAEKFAERLKELEEALLGMVVQFCQMGEYGKLKHTFMSAEEQAFDILDIKYGEKVDKVYKRFNKKWSKQIDEICREITEGLKCQE